MKEVQFVNPSTPSGNNTELTPEYTLKALTEGKQVQISVDANVVINIKKFIHDGPQNTLRAYELGLLPLIHIMQAGRVTIACPGIREVLEKNQEYSKTKEAWDIFADQTWGWVNNDPKAPITSIPKPPKDTPYSNLTPELKYLLADNYHAMLQIFLIQQSKHPSAIKFLFYAKALMNECHSISNFNLEVGRYLFWEGHRYRIFGSNGHSDSLIDSTEIGTRFRRYKRAFYKHKKTDGHYRAIDIKANCLNAAFDMNYLFLLSQHTRRKEKHNGRVVESWFATQDKDLAAIARDTHHDMDTGFVIQHHKEYEMEEWSTYWQITNGTLLDLNKATKGRLDSLSDTEVENRYYMTFANIKCLEAKIEKEYPAEQ